MRLARGRQRDRGCMVCRAYRVGNDILKHANVLLHFLGAGVRGVCGQPHQDVWVKVGRDAGKAAVGRGGEEKKERARGKRRRVVSPRDDGMVRGEADFTTVAHSRGPSLQGKEQRRNVGIVEAKERQVARRVKLFFNRLKGGGGGVSRRAAEPGTRNQTLPFSISLPSCGSRCPCERESGQCLRPT